MTTLDLPVIRVLSETIPLAKAKHFCTICGRVIEPGSRYHRYVFRNDALLDRKTSLRVAKTCFPICEV